MKAYQFNRLYSIGDLFYYRPGKYNKPAVLVKIITPALDLRNVTVVGIDIAPYYANIYSLFPAI